MVFILVDGWMIPAPDTLRVAVSLLLVASLVVAVALLFADSSKVNSENEPLLLRTQLHSQQLGNVHKNKNEFLLGFDKHLWIFGALTLWCHIGEFVGVLIPYLPKNPKLPPFNQPVPELCIVFGFALSCVVWVVLPLVLKLHERQNFHGMVFVIYSLETVV
ncbi:hypothetical protein HDV02_006411 [Globomyces sp. JEL0801]|nr:hypothetical protein HDV02_006411 [Globomyces sp. JEL0801]